MKTLNATKFKEQCLSLLDNLSNEGIVITKHGRPIAQVVPINVSYQKLIGSMKGRVNPKDDLLSTGLSWRADKQ